MTLTGRTRALVATLSILAGLLLIMFATASEQTRDIDVRDTESAQAPANDRAPRPGRGDPTAVPAAPDPFALGTATGPGIPMRVFLVVAAVIGAGLVIWYAAGLVRLPHRSRDTGREDAEIETAPADVRRTVADIVDEVLVQIERGQTRDSIIACWIRLEEVAAGVGIARRPSETAGELTERVLAAQRVDADALTRLADLYREARFSTHDLDASARIEARSALEDIRRDLTATP
jgi:Domain of unknown function (DUF4129)